MSRHSWKVRVRGLKLWIGLVMPKRHGSAGFSSTKVPNSRSQMISTPAKFAVYVLGIAGVVHPVVGGGVEDPLKPAELAHHLGVDEKLEAQNQ